MWSIFVILLFIGITFYISYRAHKAGVKTGTEYLLAGRKLGWISTFCGLFMTMMSAFTFMGMPGLTFRVGVGSWIVGLTCAVHVGMICFFYPKLRVLGKRLNYMTQADYLCDRFTNAKAFRLLIALLGIVGMIAGHFAVQTGQ